MALVNMSDSRTDRIVRSHLKTRHLVLLVELGKHRSIMHAAEAANLTQPAASKLLAELEQVLGVPLFERQARGVVPTWYGNVLIRRAGAALAELEAAHQEIADLVSGLGGRVSIGSVLAPATRLVSSAVTLMKSRHPRVNVEISVDGSKLLLDRLRAGELDIAVARIYDSAAASELNFEPITDEPHSLIVRAGHPLLARPELSLAELVQHAWIVPPAGSVVRDRITSLFASHKLDQPTETVSAMAMPAIANLLMISDMIAPLAVELVQPYLDIGSLAVLPFELNLRMDVYGIVTRRRHQLSPGAETMLATLREAAASYRTGEFD